MGLTASKTTLPSSTLNTQGNRLYVGNTEYDPLTLEKKEANVHIFPSFAVIFHPDKVQVRYTSDDVWTILAWPPHSVHLSTIHGGNTRPWYVGGGRVAFRLSAPGEKYACIDLNKRTCEPCNHNEVKGVTKISQEMEARLERELIKARNQYEYTVYEHTMKGNSIASTYLDGHKKAYEEALRLATGVTLYSFKAFPNEDGKCTVTAQGIVSPNGDLTRWSTILSCKSVLSNIYFDYKNDTEVLLVVEGGKRVKCNLITGQTSHIEGTVAEMIQWIDGDGYIVCREGKLVRQQPGN